MTWLNLIVLAVVQGITEFLPISSSAHLILVPCLGHFPDQGLDMDIAVHVGTLGAVMLYFWRDIWQMTLGLWAALRLKKTPGGRLALAVLVATVPVVLVGVVVKDYVATAGRSIAVLGWSTLIFGILLYAADRIGLTVRRIEHLKLPDAAIIGLAQAIALIPGTSRSGITMTAARLLGYERGEAARFSMLMSIPTILAAGTLAALDIVKADQPLVTTVAIYGAGLSFLTALIAIALLMRWLRHASFTPFAVYRLILGAALLAAAYGLVPGFERCLALAG
ncbi:Undecaprenyl-diphosphatase [uncultured Alphaproteobacteria bacterium]|uniref:Undecaprenyl-diphosphatase n=1 Tax=uncultured Alphaproteobacteria bacterium TaxID=91750 RepID=A0A212KHQ1_9PROT|nr:Undecaprenyl-diphosphatase [uncultured Alphaproteobacteria bacterium]